MPHNDFLNLGHQESRILGHIDSFFSSEKERMSKALALAKKEHSGQFRHSGEPYVIHPIRAALVLLEELNIKNADFICALLLHDAIEEGSVTSKDIKKTFGDKVAELVGGLTRERPDKETEEQKKKNKIEYIKKLSQKSRELQLLKLCDVLDNARSWYYIPEEDPNFKKIPRWKNELKHYLPLAEKIDANLFSLLKECISAEKKGFPQSTP